MVIETVEEILTKNLNKWLPTRMINLPGGVERVISVLPDVIWSNKNYMDTKEFPAFRIREANDMDNESKEVRAYFLMPYAMTEGDILNFVQSTGHEAASNFIVTNCSLACIVPK